MQNGNDILLRPWAGMWETGVTGRPQVGQLPPEHVVLDPAATLDPNGFASGWIMSGTVAAWKQATGAPDTAAASWYFSAKQVLYHAAMKARLLEGTGARLRWSENTYNPVAAVLPEMWCGRLQCNGDFDCSECESRELRFSPGDPAELHASDLYQLCDELFPLRGDGWQQLAWRLRHVAGLARDIPTKTLVETWSALLPTTRRLAEAKGGLYLPGWTIACTIADAVALDAGASDEECAVLAHLIDGPETGADGGRRRLMPYDKIPERLLGQLEVVRAALS